MLPVKGHECSTLDGPLEALAPSLTETLAWALVSSTANSTLRKARRMALIVMPDDPIRYPTLSFSTVKVTGDAMSLEEESLQCWKKRGGRSDVRILMPAGCRQGAARTGYDHIQGRRTVLRAMQPRQRDAWLR